MAANREKTALRYSTDLIASVIRDAARRRVPALLFGGILISAGLRLIAAHHGTAVARDAAMQVFRRLDAQPMPEPAERVIN